MKTKLLMLGPGAPGRHTSGLGKASAHLAQELSEKTQLTLIEPDQIENLEVRKKPTAKKAPITDFNILQELATVSIESRLSAYQYLEGDTSRVMEKVESHQLHEQLMTFTEELVLASKSIAFDMIYAHDWITFKAALDLKEKFKKPLIVHVHSLDYDRSFGKGSSWIYDLEKSAMDEANAVIAVSNYSKKVMIEQYDIDPGKIVVIPHGHHHKRPAKAKNPFKEKIILFVGRLSGQKGPIQFLEIAEKVNQLYPNSRFVMAGDGDLYKRLIEAGANSGIASKFHITGYLEEKELQKLYGMADVYCMPSHSEPFGLTALEAADAGLPLVLSDHCGAAEWLPESIQLNINDTDKFAESISNLLKDPELGEKQIKSNRKEIKNLTWEASVQQLMKVVEKIQA